MANRTKLLIYTTVYNEAKFIAEMLESLLAQTDRDFALVISENHSTDGTPDIIERYKHNFERISIIRPPRHLSGIEHGQFAHAHVAGYFNEYSHAMFIGGHDIISPDTIKHLKARADENPESSIIYTDTFRLSLSGEVTEHYSNSLHTSGVPRHFIPFVVLIGIGHNIMSSGIWRADVFKAASHQYVCCVADHLVLCDTALVGPIMHSAGGALYLRDAPTYVPGWRYYVEKHIPPAQRAKGCVYDITLQIRWLVSILEKALGMRASQAVPNPVHANYFLSAIQLYLIRYGDVIQGFEDSAVFQTSDLFAAVQANDLAQVLVNVTKV